MKKLKEISGMLLLLSFLSVNFASCTDDEEFIQPVVTVEDVDGSYSGKITTLQGDVKTEGAIEFTAKTDVITIEKLPVKEIVYAVIEDDAKAEEALKALGNVAYNLKYTAALTESKTGVELKFAPEALTLTLAVDGAEKVAVVTFAAKQSGIFTTIPAGQVLNFELQAEKITVDNADLTPYTTIKYQALTLKRK